MSLISKMNDRLTCKEGFDEACFNSLDEQLMSNLLENKQDLSVEGCWGSISVNQEHLLCYDLSESNFIIFTKRSYLNMNI
jgi:hypothetical protein